MTDNPSTPASADVLIGAGAIEEHLASIGFPDSDAYYLRRVGRWPIGKYGKFLLATKTNLDRHAKKLAAT
jgi:hypothetical protein